MVGRSIAQFEILEKLGAGGMGEVYRARDRRLEREVALKVLPAGALDDEAARQRLLREARTASALSHPHICTVFDAGEADGQLYIALELVRGQPLSALIPSDGLPAETVLRYGAQIAGALAHAHEHGIVHRDLKSSNVMLAADGRIKVLDFGLAIQLRNEASAATGSKLEPDDAVGGTLAYMAPEVLQGSPVDARSDLWALGVVLYEMAAGRLPFSGGTGFELTSAILRDPPAPLPAGVSPALRAIIARSLAKEPVQRYQRAGEVGAALEAAWAGSAASVAVVPARGISRRVLFAATALALAAAVPVWLVFRRAPPAAPAATARVQSIAVLPLRNLSGDPGQDYFADGTTEALIGSLAQIRALKVISRTSVMRYKSSDKSLPEIARELGVDAVVNGSVQRAGSRVRISAQLIDAATDSHLWSHSYERDMSDVLRLQSEVARAIADEIHVSLTPGERARLKVDSAANPEAHEAYLLGRYHLNKRNENDLRRAIEHFERAIGLDASHALAYAGLSEAWVERGIWGARAFREDEERSRAAALRALDLDPDLSEARAALAHVKYLYDWDWTGAEREFRRALEMDPNNSAANRFLAIMLHALGRFDEAIAAIERVRERDPLSSDVQSSYGRILHRAGRYQEALRHLERALELDPLNYGVYGRMADVYEALGDYQKALHSLQKGTAAAAAGRGSAPTRYSPGQVRLYVLMGRHEEALRVLANIQQQPAARINGHAMATVYAALGDKDRAFEWLNKAIDRRELVVFTKVEPKLASLRSDPRWAATLRRINLTP